MRPSTHLMFCNLCFSIWRHVVITYNIFHMIVKTLCNNSSIQFYFELMLLLTIPLIFHFLHFNSIFIPSLHKMQGLPQEGMLKRQQIKKHKLNNINCVESLSYYIIMKINLKEALVKFVYAGICPILL